MRLKFGIDIKAKESAGIVLIAGLVVVLASFSKFWFKRTPNYCRKQARTKKPESPAQRERIAFFQIRQTRSDLGFVYWVLQGHGRFASFTLFDTWQEAMDSTNQRLSECRKARNPEPYHSAV